LRERERQDGPRQAAANYQDIAVVFHDRQYGGLHGIVHAPARRYRQQNQKENAVCKSG
jgi:hypothetical protein